MNIVMFGPPSSGKSTVSRNLAEKVRAKYISVGEIARAEITADSQIGRTINGLIISGSFFPPSLILHLIEEELSKQVETDFILDGYPRRKDEAVLFIGLMERLGLEIDFAIELKADLAFCEELMSGRMVCSICDHSFSHLKADSLCPKCGKPSLVLRDEDNVTRLRLRYDYFESETRAAIGLIEPYLISGRRTIQVTTPTKTLTDLLCAIYSPAP